MSIHILEQPKLASQQANRSAKILIIDDDDVAVDLLSHRLSRQGFRTLAAETGRAGLDIVRTEQPDLVLLDHRLPDANGFDICQQLTDAPETCLTPVILFSSMDQPDIVRKARAAGAQFFVRKPYDPNVLLLLIREALRRPKETW